MKVFTAEINEKDTEGVALVLERIAEQVRGGMTSGADSHDDEDGVLSNYDFDMNERPDEDFKEEGELVQ